MRWERERRTFRVSSSINRIVIDWQEFFSRHDCRSPDSIFPLSQIGRETIQRLWHTGQKKCFFSVRVRESPLPTHLAKSILSPISFYPRVAHLRMKRRGHFVSALSIRIELSDGRDRGMMEQLFRPGHFSHEEVFVMNLVSRERMRGPENKVNLGK